LTTYVNMKARNNPRCAGAILLAVALMAAPSLLRAQVSLATVVDLAQRNSSEVKLAEADVKKAEAGLASTIDVLYPSGQFSSGLPLLPSVGYSGTPPSIFTSSVQALVFSPSQKKYIGAARDGLQAATLALKNAKEQVALDASIVYIELDLVNQQLAAAQQQETLSSRLIEIEQQRAEAGVDPLSELLQAQLTAEQLKLKRLHLETRAGTLMQQLAGLTGLPPGSINPDHASIPEIPRIRAHEPSGLRFGIEAAQSLASSKEKQAKGDALSVFLPQAVLSMQYNRFTTLLNNADSYYFVQQVSPGHFINVHLKPDNFASGIQINVPLFDWVHRDKARESAADALRAKVELEQAERQNEVQIAQLTGNLRELDTLSEIAGLKQQIAQEQIKAVEAQLELGNGAPPGAQAQLSPKAEQLARIEERQKFQDALDAALDLSKARLGLLRALGHMEDWLRELHGK